MHIADISLYCPLALHWWVLCTFPRRQYIWIVVSQHMQRCTAQVLLGFRESRDAEGDKAKARKSRKSLTEWLTKVSQETKRREVETTSPRCSRQRSGDFFSLLLGHHGQYTVLLGPADADPSLWLGCPGLLSCPGGHEPAVLLVRKACCRMVRSMGSEGRFGAWNGFGWNCHSAPPGGAKGGHKSKLWNTAADTFARCVGRRPRLGGSCFANDFYWWIGTKFASGVFVIAENLHGGWGSDLVTRYVLLGWIFRIWPPIGGCRRCGAFCCCEVLDQISGLNSRFACTEIRTAELQRNSRILERQILADILLQLHQLHWCNSLSAFLYTLKFVHFLLANTQFLSTWMGDQPSSCLQRASHSLACKVWWAIARCPTSD